VTLSNQPQNLIERGVDVALRFGHVEDSDLVARAVAEMHYVVCCTPEMAVSMPEDPAGLDPRLCLGITREERRALITWELRKDDRTVEIHPDGPLHFNTGADVLVAVRAGTGVGCVLDVLAAPDLASGALVQLYPQWTTPVRTLYVVTPKSRVGTAKIKVFVDFLLEMLEGQRRPDVTRPVAVRPRGNR
jgi:LysR family transcriptional regulator for bpeEF and oprC